MPHAVAGGCQACCGPCMLCVGVCWGAGCIKRGFPDALSSLLWSPKHCDTLHAVYPQSQTLHMLSCTRAVADAVADVYEQTLQQPDEPVALAQAGSAGTPSLTCASTRNMLCDAAGAHRLLGGRVCAAHLQPAPLPCWGRPSGAAPSRWALLSLQGESRGAWASMHDSDAAPLQAPAPSCTCTLPVHAHCCCARPCCATASGCTALPARHRSTACCSFYTADAKPGCWQRSPPPDSTCPSA